MNFNLFDDMNGVVLRERENNLMRENTPVDNSSNGMNGNAARFPANTPLAMAYVPFQQWGEVYSEDDAFNAGTLFPELNFPFERGGSSYE